MKQFCLPMSIIKLTTASKTVMQSFQFRVCATPMNLVACAYLECKTHTPQLTLASYKITEHKVELRASRLAADC